MKRPTKCERRAAKTSARERFTSYRALVDSQISKLRLTPKQRRRLLALCGDRPIRGFINLADFAACIEGNRLLRRALMREFKAAPKHRRYFSITMTPDVGNTSDRKPVINVGALRGMVDRALRRFKLHAVGSFEIQGLMNYPAGGTGRTLMGHVQLAGWTDDPLFDAQAAENYVNGLRSWTSALTTKPCVIKPITSGAHFARVANYLIKMPHDVTNGMPLAGQPGVFTMMTTRKGYRGEFALRILEGRSQLQLTSSVFGINEGAVLVRQWRAALNRWHATRVRAARGGVSQFDVGKLWRQIRSRNGSQHFDPFRFVSGPERPPLLPPRAHAPGVSVSSRDTATETDTGLGSIEWGSGLTFFEDDLV